MIWNLRVWILIAISSVGILHGKSPLKLEWLGMAPVIRTDAPFPVHFRLDLASDQILEGQFQFKVKSLGTTVLNYTTDTAVLTPGQREFRFLLPPLQGQDLYYTDFLDLHIAFHTSAKTFQIPKEQIPVPTGKHQFVVGISHPGTSSFIADSLFSKIRLPYLKKGKKKMALGAEVQTNFSRISTERFPTDPLKLCSNDVLLLEDKGFGELSDKALAATLRWIKGGGVAVIRCASPLKSSHLDFLNQLTNDENLIFSKDRNGALIWSAEKKFLPFQVGVGRALVIHPSLAAPTFETNKALQKQIPFIWRLSTAGRSIDSFNNASRGFSGRSELVDHMIKGVRILPFPILLLLLLGFILLIGPVDYFLLGKLKLRRWTWVTFPLTAVGIMFLTLYAARSYTGRSDHYQTLRIVDIGDDGFPVRENRIRLRFLAAQKDVEDSIQMGIGSPTQATTNHWWPNQNLNSDDIVHYEGTFPENYRIVQQIDQWSPRLIHEVSFPESDFQFEVSLADLPFSALQSSQLTVNYFQEELEKRYPGCLVYFFGESTSGKVPVKSNSDIPFSNRFVANMSCFGTSYNENYYYSKRPQQKTFTKVFDTISPSGGSTLRDLAIYDAAEKNASLIVTAVENDDGYTFYRKIIRD